MTEPENEILDGELVDAEQVEEKPATLRKVGRFVVRSSVKFVVAGVITTLVPEPENKRDRVRLFVGTYAISGMVAKAAVPFMDEKFDEWKQDILDIPDDIRTIRAEMKKLQEKSYSNETNSED